MPVRLPTLGVGLGYRPQLHEQIMSAHDHIDWLELLAESFLPLTPRRRDLLQEISSAYPCVVHSTELSLGSPGAVDKSLIAQLAELAQIVDAPWMSDHFCFTTADGIRLGHLTPVQWSSANAMRLAAKAGLVSREVGRPFLLENITYHFVIPGELSEGQFITMVLEESDCHLLLDVTNTFTNATNLNFDPAERLDSFPLDRVGQMHVAGGTWEDGVLADSHDATVADEVWPLVRHVSQQVPVPAIMLERDTAFPDDFSEIVADLHRARVSSAAQPA
jgi:uncharacterized protein (UPF0276 family)